ncbi:hypothetical protein TSAR_005457 [Trichomalopsis sarcophagae]|uniref:Uncharacterized protein n=1 Tax=Trichomalopsis sarcophagae TaxID=543379 RepID=A0A232ERC7_9HYME|nr:hypothetical protein TSAR_005457 [Trichomalopsis sarcophagae]
MSTPRVKRQPGTGRVDNSAIVPPLRTVVDGEQRESEQQTHTTSVERVTDAEVPDTLSDSHTQIALIPSHTSGRLSSPGSDNVDLRRDHTTVAPLGDASL